MGKGAVCSSDGDAEEVALLCARLRWLGWLADDHKLDGGWDERSLQYNTMTATLCYREISMLMEKSQRI